MPEQSVTKCLGLVTQYNPLSVGVGGLIQADNAVIRRENTIENRRGYQEYGTLSEEPKQLLEYRGKVLAHGASTIFADNGSGTFNAYDGQFEEPSDLVTTGNTTNASTTISNLGTITSIKLGQIVTGSGIADGTYVTAISGISITISQAATATASNVTLTFTSRRVYEALADSNCYVTTSDGVIVLQDVVQPITFTADTSSGTNTLLNVSSTNNIAVGKLIQGTGIPVSTYIAGISGTTITMTNNASASNVGVTVTATSSYRMAGAPRALGPQLALVTGGSTFATGVNVAYRTIIQRIDQNGNVIVGYPSERAWIANTAVVARNIQLINHLPDDARATDVLQVYRTRTATGTTDTAGDEEGLVYQETLDQADINLGTLTVVDSVVDELIGATIYTAPSQEGISQGNSKPPLAKDIALFKDHMFYGNTETAHILFVNLISTTNLYNGGSYGRAVIIAGTTYTSAAAENTGTGAFAATSTGVAATDIDNTARSLVRVINAYASNTSVYAYYLTTPDTLPGQIAIEARQAGGNAFTIQVGVSATAGDFFPAPPVSPATNTESTSSNQVKRNGLYVSKPSQKEAVPALNYFNVGPSNTDILRNPALRDSVIVIKEEGIYRLNGETIQSFNITPLDLTVFCRAINSVAVLANNVFMLSNQGVVAVNDTGVEVISRAIEPSVLPLLTYPNVSTYTVGIAYESERQYILSTVGSANDTGPTQSFVYNIFTKAWTRWPFGIVAGVVETQQDKLFFTRQNIAKVYRERKSFTNDDYADPEVAITITAISGDDVDFTISGSTPVEGWVISQNNTLIKISSLVTITGGYRATMANTPPAAWTTGAATAFPGIVMEIEWDAYTSGEPGYLKQLQDFKVLTDNVSTFTTASSLFATFKTDLSTTQEDVEIMSDAQGWGSSPWGSFPWGGVSQTYAFRTWPPQAKSYFRVANFGVIHQNAKERCSISGYSTTIVPVSERTNK